MRPLGIFSLQRGKLVQTTEAENKVSGITVTGSLTVGSKLTGSYLFNNATGEEANRPPSLESCFITGSITEGQTIHFNTTGHHIYNDGVIAPTVFRLYGAATIQQGGEILLYEGTNPDFLLANIHSGMFLRLEADPKQTKGANLTGETVRSTYCGPVVATTFNVISGLNWNAAWQKSTLNNFNTTFLWPNSKGGYSALGQDGVRPLPVYNATEQALEFTTAINSILAFQKPTAMSAPFEIYIRFKLKSLTSTNALIAFGNTIHAMISTTGAVAVSGGTTGPGLIVANTWYVLRIFHNGATTAIELNFDGTEFPLTSVTSSPGTGTGRVGATWSNTNWLNGFISDIYCIDTPLTTQEKIDLATWFGF
jgi:hypothetical protein